MSWAWMDDGLHEDPRTLEVDLAAIGLLTCATTYIARHLLDGVIPEKALLRLLDAGETAPLDALLRVGYLERVEAGYRVVDYLIGNDTREVVEERRAERKARAKAGAEAMHRKRREKEAAEAAKKDEPPIAGDVDIEF